MTLSLALVQAVGIGLMLGFLITTMSAGGGILAVPLMQFFLKLSHTEAVATSLAGVLGAALVGIVGHARAGRVVFRVAAIFAPTAMLGSFAGAKLHGFLPESVTLSLFALLLLFAAWRMTKPPPVALSAEVTPRYALWAATGAAVGVLGGLFGVGGGFLFVPTLVLWVGLPIKHAVGTATLIIAASSLSGAATYALDGALEAQTLVPVSLAAVVGALLGLPAVGRLPDQVLRRVFSGLAAIAALATLARAWF